MALVRPNRTEAQRKANHAKNYGKDSKLPERKFKNRRTITKKTTKGE